MRILAWIGRQRARAIAVLVLIGILTPPLGLLLKPYLTLAVMGLLCIAFLRVDVGTFRRFFHHPQLVIAATVWTTFVVPALFAFATILFDLDQSSPALFTALMLQAVASPVMAAPTFAALMGLDATLVLVTLVLSTALTPLSAPLFAALLSVDLALSPINLGMKLLAILAGSAIIGLTARKIITVSRIVRHRDEIDGINIIILFVFVSAVMGEIGIEFLTRPLLMIGLIALVFAVFLLLLLMTYFVFLRCGAKQAFAIGMMTSQRNMGLMLAGTGGVVPELTWLYFAIAQFPIYLSPLMLQPIAKIIGRQNAD